MKDPPAATRLPVPGGADGQDQPTLSKSGGADYARLSIRASEEQAMKPR